jgi:hypothetical protein
LKRLIYLCYGQESIFREATFSILSTLRFPIDKSIQIVVYSDRAECFADLGVNVRTVTDAELNDWMGGSSYIYRRKIMAVIDALQRYGDSVAFIDCDTYFLKSPGLLFELIGPGRSCLHIAEGKLKEIRTRQSPRISQLIESQEFFDLSGNKLVISPDAMVWNSGVLGVHSSDLPLMREALNLCDQLWDRDQVTEPAEQRVHTWEQFATGVFLARNNLSEASDIVFHYWRYHLRRPFTKDLEGIDSNLKNIKLPDRAYHAYESRPRETLKNTVKIFVRTWMRRVGWRVPGIRTST